MLVPLSLIPLLALPAIGDVITGIPDAAPPGYEQWVSPVVVPAPPVKGSGNWKSSVERARTFVSKLTLEEKVNVTTGQGLFGRCVGNTGTIPRLGWKGLCLQDGPQGVRFQNKASAFASAINVGSTFDADLMQRHGYAMGQEFRGKGAQVALGPMMNLIRVPAAGRNWEGAGADPFHSGVAAAAAVRGIQANNVIACAKHFIGNEQEHFRGGSLAQTISSSNIDDKTMHELYLWPFAESVHAGVASVMCSYQKVNQTQACQNSKIQNGLLKQELDFQGFIVSDWAAMINGVQPALAGLDLNMPGFRAYGQGNQNENNPVNATNSFWGSFLLEAVKNGSVPLSRLDDMVTRTFAAQYVVGQDRGFPDVNFDVNNRPGLDLDVDVQGNHAKVIREVGAASTILLKNEAKTLPLSLKKGVRRIAVIGSDAGPPRGGPNACNDRGCDGGGTVAMGWGSGTADFPYLIDPLAAINAYVKSNNASVVVDSVLSDYDYTRVTQVASAADVCLVFVNANSGEGYITVDGNAGDRNNLTLWHNGETLIKTAADACNNTVVVKHIASAVIVEDWINHPNVKSVLNAGLPGQESGNALVDVLFGAVNPSGRLTYTVPKARSDFYDDVRYTSGGQSTPQITYEEGVNIDHRYFDATGKEPRFEFGFGLSYTTFEYTGLKVRRSGASKDLWANDYEVSFKVRNTGGIDGHEVSQLYLGFPPGAGEPPLVLRGFDRSLIRAGQSKTVTIKLRRKDVSVWDTASQKWVIPQGSIKVAVGASSRSIKLRGEF